MTREEFLNHMVALHGEDYVFDLIDSGYMPVEVNLPNGTTSWKWLLVDNATFRELTQSRLSATV